MIKLQDTVFRNLGTKQSPKVVQQDYERIYFTHASGDSKTSLDNLWNQMVDWLKVEEPKTDYRLQIMEHLSNAINTSKAGAIGTTLVPKELDLNKTLEKNAKAMVDLYVVTHGAVGEQYKTYEAALATLKAQVSGADAPETEANTASA